MIHPVHRDFLYQMRVDLQDALDLLRKAYNANVNERRGYAREAAETMEKAAKSLRKELERTQ